MVASRGGVDAEETEQWPNCEFPGQRRRGRSQETWPAEDLSPLRGPAGWRRPAGEMNALLLQAERRSVLAAAPEGMGAEGSVGEKTSVYGSLLTSPILNPSWSQ